MTARFERPALVVVKVGSSSLREPVTGRLDRAQVTSLSDQIATVRATGTQVVLVSSGAVAAGMGQLGLDRRPTDLPTLQAAAAVGQGELVHAYAQDLGAHGIPAAQILLSQDDFVRRNRYLNARTTLRRLLELGAVPVINENDAVATEELAYGDNDHLAALVASMLDARLLVMLSDVEGLYDGDPSGGTASLVRTVEDVTTLDVSMVGGSGSHVGSGGMRTKVESARVAVLSGANAVVANARQPGIIADVVSGDECGTWFVAAAKRVESRRLWIGFALSPHGRISVDAGAERALLERGVSLLAVGVTGAEGDFTAGDAVELVGPTGRVIGRGLARFDAADVARMAGRSTAAAAEELGSAFAREVIHRDDLVVFGQGGVTVA